MDDCSDNAICTNTPGNFSCMTCDKGYVSNDTACVGKHVIPELETIMYIIVHG